MLEKKQAAWYVSQLSPQKAARVQENTPKPLGEGQGSAAERLPSTLHCARERRPAVACHSLPGSGEQIRQSVGTDAAINAAL
ncbi:unnamed protein product [Boreogadus saida]